MSPFTHQQQNASECQAKHQWSRHVRVLEYLLVCAAQRIKHGQSLQREGEREREKQCKLIGLKLKKRNKWAVGCTVLALIRHGIYSCDNPSSSFTCNTTCGRIRHNLFVPGTAVIKPKTHGLVRFLNSSTRIRRYFCPLSHALAVCVCVHSQWNLKNGNWW